MIVADTHAVVWLTQGGQLLSPSARKAMEEARKNGGLAIIDYTLIEIAGLIAKRRLSVDAPTSVYLSFIESMFTVLPVDSRIAERAMRFGPRYPMDHADRLIGATAVVHEARLVTKDSLIRASGEVDCLW